MEPCEFDEFACSLFNRSGNKGSYTVAKYTARYSLAVLRNS
jgi:hypothetical protein